MVNCSLKLRIDTKNCIKCTHNLIFSCSAVCWNLNLDFPISRWVLPSHLQHQQPGQRQWSLYSLWVITLHRLWASSKTNSLPMSYMQGQYYLSRQQGKEKSPKSPFTELHMPTCCSGGHGEHWNLPWGHGNKLPVWFPSSQCCTTAVQFSFFSQSLELKNQLNSWFNCPGQIGTNFSVGVTFVKGQCSKLRSIKSSPNS